MESVICLSVRLSTGNIFVLTKNKSTKMKKVLINLILIVELAFLSVQAISQESLNSCGGNLSGSGGSVSYTYGQTFYATASGADAYLIEGVQQPFEISVITILEEESAVDIILSVFPNPVADYLSLKSENIELPITALLMDVNGRIINDIVVSNTESIIDMSNLVAATYFLKIIKSEKEIKTFKIIKTQ